MSGITFNASGQLPGARCLKPFSPGRQWDQSGAIRGCTTDPTAVAWSEGQAAWALQCPRALPLPSCTGRRPPGGEHGATSLHPSPLLSLEHGDPCSSPPVSSLPRVITWETQPRTHPRALKQETRGCRGAGPHPMSPLQASAQDPCPPPPRSPFPLTPSSPGAVP